jgi:lysophospholipase L1-like esterase
MKIAFYGDSLTEGKFGASFIEAFEKRLPDYELLNYGHGGDTVISLYTRLVQMPCVERADLAVLWIGVNDVFNQMTLLYRIINKIRKKPYASNRTQFKSFYRAILDCLLQVAKKIITIPPLFLGEDIQSEWNRKLEELSHEIRTISEEYENVTYALLRKAFMKKLQGKHMSSYLPTSLIQFARDKSTCTTLREIDRISFERDLTFTLDGVHLNSRGAELVADFLKVIIEKTIRMIRI